mgnify:CR=1 FL=1
MSSIVTAPSPTALQFSGVLPTGGPMLSVLAKRTYTVDADGRCAPAEDQVPLFGAPEPDPDDPALLVADTDQHPYKPRTDVVVLGRAYGSARARRLDVSVHVAGRDKRIAVLGERTCSLGPGGRIQLSEPGPIDQVPLSYKLAYGGRDRGAELKYGNPLKTAPTLPQGMKGVDLDAASPFLYPRNPCGRGYLVEPTAEAVELLELPQLEDPTDLLTPARLAAGWIDQWHRMPLPQSTGWIDYGWYPRVAFFGIVPVVDYFDEPPLEVERGLAPAFLRDGTGETPPESRFELTCGASLGLQLPHLRGGEPVELRGLHRRRPRWGLTVPPPPRIWIDGRNGKLTPTEPVLHTLSIEPDEDRVTLVWRGCAPAIRAYAPQELESMPLRVEWRD